MGSPKFLSLQDGEQRYAMFEITDLQNHVFVSDLFPLPNPYRQRIDLENGVLWDDETLYAAIEEITAVTGAYPCLCLTYQLKNRTQDKFSVHFSGFSFNQTPDPQAPRSFFGSSSSVDPQDGTSFFIRIPADVFRQMGERMIYSIDFSLSITDEDDHTIFSAPHSSACGI